MALSNPSGKATTMDSTAIRKVGADEGQDAEMLGLEERGPAGAGDEFDEGDFAKELESLEEENKYDACRRENGHHGTDDHKGRYYSFGQNLPPAGSKGPSFWSGTHNL